MQKHRYQLTRLSANKKLGGLPASSTSMSTCPTRCSFRDNGCYASSGPIFVNWRALSDGRRGTDLDEFCEGVRKLPKQQLWRWAQAGDLPGDGARINRTALNKIVHANRGRSGFGYSHYNPRLKKNSEALRHANENGFTLNLSAETLAEADEFVALNLAPVVVVLPTEQRGNLKTPGGNTVVVCPASLGPEVTCATCAICANAGRKFVVGFPAHGSGKKRVVKIFNASP